MSKDNRLPYLLRGGASVELVVILAIIFMLMYASLNLFLIINTKSSLDSAIRTGLLSGKDLLNHLSDFSRDDEGDIFIPTNLESTVEDFTEEVAPDGTQVTATLHCRCPEFDFSTPVNSDLLSCEGSSVIQDCEFLPEIFIIISATVPVDFFAGDLLPSITVSGSAVIAAR